MSPRSLPPRPNLGHLKNQAKDLLKAYRLRQPAAIARFRKSLPRLFGQRRGHSDRPPLSLRDAQHVVALEYGFSNWPQLHANIRKREEVPMIEMTVHRVIVNRNAQQRIVVLKGTDVNQYLPIWVGSTEGDSIASKVQGKDMPRPMTHDLMDSMISDLGARVIRVVVNSLQEDVYLGKIVLQRNGTTMERDSRPSDALALAVRTGASIYAEEDVLDRAGISFDPKTGHPVSTNLRWAAPSINEIENEFSDEAQSLLARAREQSNGIGRKEVTPEDILLAAIYEPGEVCARVFANLELDINSVRSKLEEHAGSRASSIIREPLQFNEECQRALTMARTEAYILLNGQVGAEHILIGLGLIGEGLASRILKDSGFDTEAVRKVTIKLFESADCPT